MRIAIGGLWHESNTFSEARTMLADFRNFQISEGEEVIARNRGVRNEIGGFMENSGQLGFEMAPLLFSGALPSAMVSGEAYQFLRGRMLDRLRKAMPLDGVLLALHGATVAEGVDDVEMDLLAGIRGITGASCPIVVTIDLHANPSEGMVNLADVVVGYDTYPHVDIHARGCEAAEIMKELLTGVVVSKSFRKLPLLTAPQAQGTSDEPMRSIMQRLHDWEREPGMLSATVTAGYPYSDVPRLGMTVMAYSKAGQNLADRCSKEIAALIWGHREDFTVRNTLPGEAVLQAVAAPVGPVILVDVADNIGGGTPGDGTVLLRELLRQRAQGAVVTIADPDSVAAAIAAGLSGEVEILVGGKSDSWHGDPVPVCGVVHRISAGIYTHRGSYMAGLRVDMGRTVVVVVGGVEIVLMERKALPFDAEQLRCVGIEPAERKMIVVKSALAWKAAYGDIARQIIYVDTPGLCSSRLHSFPYRKIVRPVYPLDPLTTYAY